MTLILDDEYEVVDNLITVTYYSKVNDTNPFPTGVTVPNVLKRVTDKKLMESGRSYIWATFHVWENQLTPTPKANDKLTDSDGAWIVKEVSVETLETRYKLTAVHTT